MEKEVMKNPGKIFKMPDDRKVILYSDQPLFDKGKFVLYLVNDNFETLGKTLLKDIKTFPDEMKTYELIGYVD